MRKYLPHIVASFVFILLFSVAPDVFAQPAGAPLSGSAPIPNVGAVEGWLKEGAVQAIAWIAVGILSLFAWLVGITGVLLNYAITYLVIGMGDMILTGGFGVAIESLWKVIRDLVNLTFIFALLWLGITTIIQGSTSKVKSVLASIIISMLLVNFSLYFAKAVIDVGNFTAFTIYNQMARQDGSPGYISNEGVGLSGVFAHRVGVTSLIMSGQGSVQESILKKATSQGSVGFLIVYALGASFFLFKLALVFALGAFLLVVRFVTLILVMIFAPIAFLPTDIPALKRLRDRWINTLLTQSFLAPVYLFGLYVTLLVLMHTPWQTQGGLAALFTGAAGTGGGTNFIAGFQALLFYVIAIAMLLGTTIASKSLAASGAEVSKVLTKAAGKGIAGASSTGGFMGRNIGGRIGRLAAESNWIKTKASQGGLGGFAARRAFDAGSAAYKGTWDLRGVKAVGVAAKTAGVDVGKASSQTREKRLKDIKKKELEYAESLNNELTDDSPEKKAVKEHEGKIEALTKARIEAVKAGKMSEAQQLRTQIEVEKDALTEAKKVETVAKSANQERYAKEVLEPGQPFGIGGSWLPWRSKYENKKAAEHIRDSIKKKKNKNNTDRITEALEKNAEKAAKKDDH